MSSIKPNCSGAGLQAATLADTGVVAGPDVVGPEPDAVPEPGPGVVATALEPPFVAGAVETMELAGGGAAGIATVSAASVGSAGMEYSLSTIPSQPGA